MYLFRIWGRKFYLFTICHTFCWGFCKHQFNLFSQQCRSIDSSTLVFQTKTLSLTYRSRRRVPVPQLSKKSQASLPGPYDAKARSFQTYLQAEGKEQGKRKMKESKEHIWGGQILDKEGDQEEVGELVFFKVKSRKKESGVDEDRKNCLGKGHLRDV